MAKKIIELNELSLPFNLNNLTKEQLKILAIIFALISFIIILIVYKCCKYFRRRRRNQLNQNSKKFKNIVLVNNLKPDLKPISQQFQINTAYASQTNFNRLFPYHSAYNQPKNSISTNLTENLQPKFYFNDLINGSEQKNPSFNLENNLYLSKKFINLNDANNNQLDKNDLLEKKSILNSTDSSDPKSEESDNDNQILNKKSQRINVARPISIKFNLLYSSKDSTIYIEILSVDNLISNGKNSYYYVKINLRDQTREFNFKSQKTKLTKGLTSSVFFNETKQYTVNRFEKISDCSLQLSCYNRIRSLSRKQLIGDILVDLSRPDLAENFKLMFEEQLTPICLVTGKKLTPTYCTGTLGFLKLELQLLMNEKNDKHRIKVTIKNAKNLPLKYNSSLDLNKSNNVFIGHPEFYLILNLYYGQEKLDSKETNSSFSNNPNWDQSLIFNINEYSAFDEKFILDQNSSANRTEISRRLFRSKLKHLRLEITVYKGNFYSKHASIGQIKIGDKGSIDGILHWNLMCNSNKSVIKWHEIRNLIV